MAFIILVKKSEETVIQTESLDKTNPLIESTTEESSNEDEAPSSMSTSKSMKNLNHTNVAALETSENIKSQSNQQKQRPVTPLPPAPASNFTPKKWNASSNALFNQIQSTNTPPPRSPAQITATAATHQAIAPIQAPQPLIASVQPWSNTNDISYPSSSATNTFPPTPTAYNTQYSNYYNQQIPQPQQAPYYNNHNYNSNYKPMSSYHPQYYNNPQYSNQFSQYGYGANTAPIVSSSTSPTMPYQASYYNNPGVLPTQLPPILPPYHQVSTYPNSTATPPPQLPANRPDLQTLGYQTGYPASNQYNIGGVNPTSTGATVYGINNYPTMPSTSYPINTNYLYNNSSGNQFYNGNGSSTSSYAGSQ